MDAYGASDQAGRGMRHVNRVRRGPPDQIKSTCLNPCVITAMIEFGGEHRDRQIAIQRRKNNTFL